MNELDALVLAGRVNRGALAGEEEVPFEALIDVAGRPMVRHVVEALAAARSVAGIVVVGPARLLRPHLPAEVILVEPGGNLVASMRNGFRALAEKRPCLVVASDIPLVTGAMLDEFVEACRSTGASLCCPIVPREVCESRFPEVRRTYASLREGTFTLGNCFYVAPEAREPVLAQLEVFYALRKRPLRLARQLGLRMIVKYLLRTASLGELEALAAARLGVPARAVVCRHPEIGVDVDKPADLILARSV
ncbi:MAG: nucleotidyltransferase family protein, partial [Clostridia bacterium]|nr:nucleotidyltransferase family protein [Clostridia bacterium]